MTKIYSREYFSQTPPHFAWLRLERSVNDTDHMHRQHSPVNTQDARAAFKDARMAYLGNLKAGKNGRGAAEALPKGVDTVGYTQEKEQAQQKYTRDLRKIHHDWAYAIRHALSQNRAPWLAPVEPVNKSLLGWWVDTDLNEAKKENEQAQTESRRARELPMESQPMDSGGVQLKNEDPAQVAPRASTIDQDYKGPHPYDHQTAPYSQPHNHVAGSNGVVSGPSLLQRSSGSNPTTHNAQRPPQNFNNADARHSFQFVTTPSQGSIDLHQLYQEVPRKAGAQIPYSVPASQSPAYPPPQAQGHQMHANIQQRPPGIPTQPYRLSSSRSILGGNLSTEAHGGGRYQSHQPDQPSYKGRTDTVYPSSYPQGNSSQGSFPQSVPADKMYEHLLSDHHNLQRQRHSPVYPHQPIDPAKLREGDGAQPLYHPTSYMHQASKQYGSHMPGPFTTDQSLEDLQIRLGYQAQAQQAHSTPQRNFINSQHELVYDENTGQMHPLPVESEGKGQTSVPTPGSVGQYHSFHIQEEMDSPYGSQQHLSPARRSPTPQGNSAPPEFYYNNSSDVPLPGTPARSASIHSEFSHRDTSQSYIGPVDGHTTIGGYQSLHTSIPQQPWESKPPAHQYRDSRTMGSPHQHGALDAQEAAIFPCGGLLNGSFPAPMPTHPSVRPFGVAHARPKSAAPQSPVHDVRGQSQMGHGGSPARKSPQSARNTPFDDPVSRNEPLSVPKQRDPGTPFKRETMAEHPLNQPIDSGGRLRVPEETTSSPERDQRDQQVPSFQLNKYKKGHPHSAQSEGSFSNPASPLRTPGASPYRERGAVDEVDRTFTLGGHEATSSSSEGGEESNIQQQPQQQPRGWRLRVEGSGVDVIGRWRLRMQEGIVEAADMVGQIPSEGGRDGAGKWTDKQERLRELEMLIKLVAQDVDLPPSPNGNRPRRHMQGYGRVSSLELEENLQEIRQAIAEVIDAKE